MLHTYIIQGYTGPNADFQFEYTSDSMLNEAVIKRALLANVKRGTDWYAAIEAVDPYYLSRDEERSDLRDSDTQRVYLFENNADADEDGQVSDRDLFMVTIDEK